MQWYIYFEYKYTLENDNLSHTDFVPGIPKNEHVAREFFVWKKNTFLDITFFEIQKINEKYNRCKKYIFRRSIKYFGGLQVISVIVMML